VIFEAF